LSYLLKSDDEASIRGEFGFLIGYLRSPAMHCHTIPEILPKSRGLASRDLHPYRLTNLPGLGCRGASFRLRDNRLIDVPPHLSRV
jgi:hypothetical protein